MTSKAGTPRAQGLVELEIDTPIWDRLFLIAPLVIVGTRDDDGKADLAPKHMAMPMGWSNYFGFVCSPEHGTCRNIGRSGEFTVSFPKPSQLLSTSLAASPRADGGQKPIVELLETFPATEVDADLLADAYLHLECRHFRTIDGFGKNCLITGEVIAARADDDYLRRSDLDDQDLIRRAPLLAYVTPGRFATIDTSNAFPFPEGMQK